LSAFYALAHDDRIEMLTDGAVYEDDGTLTAIRRKVWYSETIPMAITGRGNAKAVELLAMACLLTDVYGSVDGVIENVQTLLDKMADKAAATESEPAMIEMLVAAISETRGPMLLYASNANAYGLDWLEPFKLYDVGREWGGGAPIDPAGLDLSAGLRSCGVELFERMRRVSDINPARPDLPAIHGIGGHVDLTTITASGVFVERLRTWSDVVGEKIDPFRGELAEAA
jgi:hypothetical protein